MRVDLSGKVAVITGAGRGIGAKYARSVAENGGVVVLADIDAEALAGQKRTVDEAGEARYRTVNLCDLDAMEELADGVVEEFGRLDIWVNNAGAYLRGVAYEVDEQSWDTVQAVNLRAAFFGCQVAAKHMRNMQGGAIVNTVSIAAFRASPGRTAYAVAKAGVAHMTRCLAVEYAPAKIRVNAIAPGFIDTRMLDWARKDGNALKDILAGVPLGRIGDTEELVGPLLFLISDAASYVTGQVLAVDGGASIV